MKSAIFINSLGGGGSERVVSVILSAAAAMDCDVELVCIEKNIFYKIPPSIKITYLSNFDGKESKIVKLLFLPILAFRLARYIFKNKIELVQSHMFRANIVNIAAKLFGARHKTHAVEVISIDFFKSQIINLALIKIFYPFADMFIFKSKAMVADMENFLGKPVNSKVVYNPFDIAAIEEMSKEELDSGIFEDGYKYIVTVGRLDDQKNQIMILEAMMLLPQDIRLIIVGDGENRLNLEDFISRYGLSERVYFAGRVKNPFKYMARADVFVLSSKYEGFPNVLVEAMSCGLPIVSTDCKTGPMEIISINGRSSCLSKGDIEYSDFGILVAIDDGESLANAVKSVVFDESVGLKYAKASYNRAIELSKTSSVNEYLYFCERQLA